MEKLNEYLQKLLSSCSDELRFEPDRNPFLVSGTRTADLAQVPMAGSQISMMVFPLIPPDVKAILPNQAEVGFEFSNEIGKFAFLIQKSPSGFLVTIRPMLTEAERSMRTPAPEPEVELETTAPPELPIPEYSDEAPEIEYSSQALADFAPTFASADPGFSDNANSQAPSVFQFESASAAYEYTSAGQAENASVPELMIEERETAAEYVPGPGPEIEIVDVNDPQYQTVFSDTAAYEPPGRRDDYNMHEYTPADADPPMRRRTDRDPETVSSFQPQRTAPAAEYEPATAYEPIAYHPGPAVQEYSPQEYVPQPMQPRFEPVTVPEVPPQFEPAPANGIMTAKMEALFRKMAEIGASDLHLSVSMPPMIRKDGKMCRLEADAPAVTSDMMNELLPSIMPRKNQEEFNERHDTDFAYEIPGLARFRCNVFMDRKGWGGVFRIIPSDILTAEKLGLSKAIMDLCTLSKGLVVVTGPTGSGKSTTLCAMVDHINKSREDHIITIEDPIEFTHENHKCLVNQREVHNHTDSFKDALRAALREDPDILLVGEMRDLETISIAIETAETGHLVFGTLHTTTASSTVDRIIDQFPADRQQQIRVMLSESLKGVIAQTLLPKKGGGRVAALEVLIITPAISNLIREGKTFQIPSAMQTGKNHGMVMLNDALFALVQNGTVEPRDAYLKAVDKTGFETMLTRGGFSL